MPGHCEGQVDRADLIKLASRIRARTRDVEVIALCDAVIEPGAVQGAVEGLRCLFAPWPTCHPCRAAR
jgi:hypothetical protein